MDSKCSVTQLIDFLRQFPGEAKVLGSLEIKIIEENEEHLAGIISVSRDEVRRLKI